MSLQKEATKRVLVVLEPSDSASLSTTIELAKVFLQETSRAELDCISSQTTETDALEAEKIKLDTQFIRTWVLSVKTASTLIQGLVSSLCIVETLKFGEYIMKAHLIVRLIS